METEYSVYQAARELNCSSQWIRVLLAEQRLEGAYKAGREWRIPQSAIEAQRQMRAIGAQQVSA